MSKTVIGVLAVVGVVLFLSGTLILNFFGFQNTANGHEADIKAQYTKNQNVYDNGYKEVLEMAQVPEAYAADLERVYRAAIEGRYGENGSQAVMQWITEQNPNLDSSVYKRIQQSIEIFRNEFQQEQTQLVSRWQQYDRFLTTNTSSRFYNWISGGSYPKIDREEFAIVTSARTDRAFDTKQDEALQLPRRQAPAAPTASPAR